MSDPRVFDTTEILESYGYVFVTSDNLIGFMRRDQPEIHHGDSFPWVMATVGGMRNKEEMVGVNGKNPQVLNAEGFVGRPPTPQEIANQQLALKLGAKIVWPDDEYCSPHFPNWKIIQHPFYYGEKTPNVRNVGTVHRQILTIHAGSCDDLQDILSARNKRQTDPKFIHELKFLTSDDFETTVLGGNHSLKEGEIAFIRDLYEDLELADSWKDYPVAMFEAA